MKKIVALSILSAATLALGACAKTGESANAADNAANETAVVEGNFAENATADNVVAAENATDAAATNATEANTANAINAN